MTRARRWLRRLGIAAIAAGGLTIDAALLLLLSPIPAKQLTVACLVGIGVVALGMSLLGLAGRSSPPASESPVSRDSSEH